MAESASVPAVPPKPKWDAVHGTDLLIGVGILWGVDIVLSVVLVLCLFIGWGFSARVQDHPAFLVVVTLVSSLATLAVTWVLVCRKYGKTFRAGFGFTALRRRTVLWCVLIGAGYAVLAMPVLVRFSTGKSMLEQVARTPFGLGCLLFLMFALPPVEELYYRGFLFPVLQRRWGGVAAVLVVSVWFGAAHGSQLLLDPIGIPIVALAGAIWTVQRLVTGSLTAPLISHLAYNACLGLMTVVDAVLGGSLR